MMVHTRHKPTDSSSIPQIAPIVPSQQTAELPVVSSPTPSNSVAPNPPLIPSVPDSAEFPRSVSVEEKLTSGADAITDATPSDALAASSSAKTEAPTPGDAAETDEDPLNAKGPGGGPAKKMRRSKKEFRWLEVIGGPCHSEKQTNSGMNLAEVKRKYKVMKCTVCAVYNPSTPWATARPRKFEYDTFADHEKSVHHTKAIANQELNDPESVSERIVTDPVAAAVAFRAMNGTNFGKDSDSEADKPLDGGDGSSSGSSDGTTTAAAAVATAVFDDPLVRKKRKRVRKTDVPLAAVPKIPTTKGLLKPALMQPKTIATNGALRPAWLMTDGDMRLSEKQLSEPQVGEAKKKYKNVRCSICQEFNPASHWAQWKPRKFESSLLLEHEKSSMHSKAVELQRVAIAAGASSSIAAAFSATASIPLMGVPSVVMAEQSAISAAAAAATAEQISADPNPAVITTTAEYDAIVSEEPASADTVVPMEVVPPSMDIAPPAEVATVVDATPAVEPSAPTADTATENEEYHPKKARK